jgi:hypothetical protein
MPLIAEEEDDFELDERVKSTSAKAVPEPLLTEDMTAPRLNLDK